MKKILSLIATLLVAVLAFAGCGSDSSSESSGTSAVAQNSSGMKTLKVGATAVPHAEILEAVKPILEKEGIKLDIIEFNDYVQPNLALNDKELDANFFQHEPYLKNFMEEHKEVKLVNAAGIHIEPMGVYSKKVKDLKELKDGASIAIPNDPTNGGRALKVLETAGLIKVRPEAGVTATIGDVIDNPKKVKFREIEAAQLPRALDDVALAVINSNYALGAGLNPVKDALAIESKDSPYANIVAVRAGDENREALQKLKAALTSPEVKKFIETEYKGAVVPAF